MTRSRSSSLRPSRAASSTQEPAVGRAQPSLGGAEADPPLQLVELPLPLGELGDGQLGVVGRAGGRIAQERPAQRGDLVEIELVRVPGLRVPRPHRPGRLLALQRSLDLGPIGPRIDSQPRVVVGHHGSQRYENTAPGGACTGRTRLAGWRSLPILRPRLDRLHRQGAHRRFGSTGRSVDRFAEEGRSEVAMKPPEMESRFRKAGRATVEVNPPPPIVADPARVGQADVARSGRVGRAFPPDPVRSDGSDLHHRLPDRTDQPGRTGRPPPIRVIREIRGEDPAGYAPIRPGQAGKPTTSRPFQGMRWAA